MIWLKGICVISCMIFGMRCIRKETQMTVKEQIDYMIQSLQIAKDELNYAEKYMKEKEKDKDFWFYGHMGFDSRLPNGTIIRESLKTVGRMANIVANNVVLSSYSGDKIYKD